MLSFLYFFAVGIPLCFRWWMRPIHPSLLVRRICRLMTKHRFYSSYLSLILLSCLTFICVRGYYLCPKRRNRFVASLVHGTPSCSTDPCSVLFVQPSELISPQQVDVFSIDPPLRSTSRVQPIVFLPACKTRKILSNRDWSFTLDMSSFPREIKIVHSRWVGVAL